MGIKLKSSPVEARGRGLLWAGLAKARALR